MVTSIISSSSSPSITISLSLCLINDFVPTPPDKIKLSTVIVFGRPLGTGRYKAVPLVRSAPSFNGVNLVISTSPSSTVRSETDDCSKPVPNSTFDVK
ncbi:hypothetical protein BLOT_003498 [Blomia tropicalis]|nr:hypothetical protein BLOT_003498 [Blomia tropicalis]